MKRRANSNYKPMPKLIDYVAVDIRDGKFFKKGKEVPIEFGNWEQIRVMNYALARLDAFKGDGLVVEPWFTKQVIGHVEFKCACGCMLTFSTDIDGEDDLERIEGTERCIKCGQAYKIELSEGGENIVVKFKKEKF